MTPLEATGAAVLGAAALACAALALLRLLRAGDDGDPRRAARAALGSGPPAAPPAARAPLHFDAGDDDLILAIFAAHAAGDAAFQREVCVRFGLVDPRTGHPMHAPYTAYTEAIRRITTTRMDLYERFVREASGRWREYAEAKLASRG